MGSSSWMMMMMMMMVIVMVMVMVMVMMMMMMAGRARHTNLRLVYFFTTGRVFFRIEELLQNRRASSE